MLFESIGLEDSLLNSFFLKRGSISGSTFYGTNVRSPFLPFLPFEQKKINF